MDENHVYLPILGGGVWCGTVTFIMLLAIHAHCEQTKTRQCQGPVITTSPFWADWQSSIGSQLARRDWAANTNDEATSSSSASEDSLYEEVAGQVSDIEYIEAVNWECDAHAIHFWRPFEDCPLPKTVSHY